MKNKKIMAVFVCLGLLMFTVFTGCGTPVVKLENTDVKSSAGETQLGSISKEKPQKMGGKDILTDYQLPFNLTKIPDKPKLSVKFFVSDKGTCPVTYNPTTFKINGHLIKELDFRTFDLGEDKMLVIDIPRSILKIGRNLLAVQNGGCQLGIDAMKMENLSILQ